MTLHVFKFDITFRIPAFFEGITEIIGGRGAEEGESRHNEEGCFCDIEKKTQKCSLKDSQGLMHVYRNRLLRSFVMYI